MIPARRRYLLCTSSTAAITLLVVATHGQTLSPRESARTLLSNFAPPAVQQGLNPDTSYWPGSPEMRRRRAGPVLRAAGPPAGHRRAGQDQAAEAARVAEVGAHTQLAGPPGAAGRELARAVDAVACKAQDGDGRVGPGDALHILRARQPGLGSQRPRAAPEVRGRFAPARARPAAPGVAQDGITDALRFRHAPAARQRGQRVAALQHVAHFDIFLDAVKARTAGTEQH